MSKEGAIRSLKQQLGATPPPGLRALTEEELQDLSQAIREASHRQAKALEAAGERALSRIPRPLRGPVRKVAGG
jgi:hypothetical protein